MYCECLNRLGDQSTKSLKFRGTRINIEIYGQKLNEGGHGFHSVSVIFLSPSSVFIVETNLLFFDHNCGKRKSC